MTRQVKPLTKLTVDSLLKGDRPGYHRDAGCRGLYLLVTSPIRTSSPTHEGSSRLASGRSVFPASLDLWLESLGVELVVTVPSSGQTNIASARSPVVAPPRMTVKRAEKMRALHAAGRSRNTLWRMFQCSPSLVDDILSGRAYVPGRSR